MWWNELLLWNISAIKFKIEFFIEVFFDVINIFQFAKTQMVNLVTEIKSHAFLVYSLDGLWIMMSRNMEITRNFVDVNKSTHFTPFVVFNLIFSFFKSSFRLIHSFLTFFMFICIVGLGVDFGMSIFIDMGKHS